jgi:DNA modification methylase
MVKRNANMTRGGAAMSDNTLYYGDNLDILKRYIKDETVDLIYLDPPFNSNATYNVLFADHDGGQAASQLQAFKDTWSWKEAAAIYAELTLEQGAVGDAIRAFGKLLHEKGGLLAYLVMMAPRLAQLHRALKPTGSLYLHCDPTASHYLKVLMDAIFGPENFRTEISWKRGSAHSDTKQGRKQHGHIHDVILFYTKSDIWTWNPIYSSYDPDYVEQFYRHVEKETGRRYRISDLTAAKPGGDTLYEWKGAKPYQGRYWAYSRENMERFEREGRLVYTKSGMPCYKRYLDEMPGVPLQDVWTDIQPIGASAAERLGYPTQKPEALLERIIQASSNEGDVVLDPFCGCGTAIAVAQRLNRRWIGIDITQAAIVTIKERLADSHADASYQVIGEPTSLPDAAALAASDPYQFQWWALGLVGARPAEQKKGADKGIDGRLPFREKPGGEVKMVILSVKAGHSGVAHVHELRGVIEREGAAIGVLITLQEPTGPMQAEAGVAGSYSSPWGKHPRLQLLTIAELLAGKKIDMPQTEGVNIAFKQAPKSKGKGAKGKQLALGEN